MLKATHQKKKTLLLIVTAILKRNVINHLRRPWPSKKHLYMCVKCFCTSRHTQRHMLPPWRSKCGLWTRRIGLPWKSVADTKSRALIQNAESSFSQNFRVTCVHVRVSEALTGKYYDNYVNNKMSESLKDKEPTSKWTVDVQISLWFLVWCYQSKVCSLGESKNCHSFSSLDHSFKLLVGTHLIKHAQLSPISWWKMTSMPMGSGLFMTAMCSGSSPELSSSTKPSHMNQG